MNFKACAWFIWPAYILAQLSAIRDSLLFVRMQFYTKGKNEHSKFAGAL